MTMNTRVHIAKPVNPEDLFLGVLKVLEADPSFTPSWDRPPDPSGWGPATPGPLRLGKATYRHDRKGEPMFRADGTPFCHSTTGEQFRAPENEYSTTLGQGLCAIWEVTYAADGPLEWPGSEYYEDGDEPDPASMPVHLVSANFDTAYSYKTANGAGCSDLHAFILTLIWAHLDKLGVDEWVWQHEERGSWHGPAEIGLRGNAELAAAHWGLV